MFARRVTSRALRLSSTTSARTFFTSASSARTAVRRPQPLPTAITQPIATSTIRSYASSSSNKSLADEKIDEITELYATAQDEFEIAMEETEKQTVYAEDDRAAAREELENVKRVFEEVVEGSDRELAEEVQRRIGQRVRELEAGVQRMEEMALEQD